MVRLSKWSKWPTLLLSLHTFWFIKQEERIPEYREGLGWRGWNVLGRVRARTVFQRDYVLLSACKFPTLVQVSDHKQKTLFS